MLNTAQLVYLLGEADNVVVKLLTFIVSEHPAENLNTDPKCFEVLELVAEGTAYCDVVRECFGAERIIPADSELDTFVKSMTGGN